MSENLRPTPETDQHRDVHEGDWCPEGHVPIEVAENLERQRDEAREQRDTATARAERAEARLREFCRENPSRWKRLELMDLRDQLREVLERFLEAVPEVPPDLIAKAREAIEAAKAHEKEMESKANEGHED